MPRDDWYRRTTWTAHDKSEFHARLKRSRRSNRSQYIRIQAWHLLQIGTEEMLREALGLLELQIAEYPDPGELSMAFSARAQCFADLGDHERAIDSFRSALEAERRLPNVRTGAYLAFGELVTALKRRDLYPEVMAISEEFGGDETFPTERFSAASVHAVISEDLGNFEDAQTYAQAALRALADDKSPFRRHPDLGLVRFVDPELLDKLRMLAEDGV